MSLLADQTHVNLLGNVHGGEVMRLVDSTAGAVAHSTAAVRPSPRRWTRWRSCSPSTSATLRTMAQVNWAGRTSMEIGVRVESERWDEAGGERVHVASAYLVFVAIDEHGHPGRSPDCWPRRPASGVASARPGSAAPPPARRAEIERGRDSSGAP